VISAFQNLVSHPILSAIGVIVAIVGFFLLKGQIMPWIQKYQDGQNQKAQEEQSQGSQHDNQQANSDVDQVFKDGPPQQSSR
jgi:p-aminobenzoyl-glutamate transporter AbgT